MGDIQQSPCLWTGLYHCFRCLTLYFLTLSTDPMCPPEQKDLFIGSSWQWISSESNKYQPKYILKLENHPKKKKRFIKLALPVPPKITAQEKNPQSETCSVKTHLKHVAVVCTKTSEPHAHSSGLEQKKTAHRNIPYELSDSISFTKNDWW